MSRVPPWTRRGRLKLSRPYSFVGNHGQAPVETKQPLDLLTRQVDPAAKNSFQPHSVMAAPIEEKQLHKSLKVSGIALTMALLTALPAAAVDINVGGGNGVLGGGGSNGANATVNTNLLNDSG